LQRRKHPAWGEVQIQYFEVQIADFSAGVHGWCDGRVYQEEQ
jgi:hypothetical protein